MSICKECSKLQKTCCQDADIVVTDKDIERIMSLGLFNFHDVVFSEKLTQSIFEDDPNYTRYVVDKTGKSQILKKQENGNCIFLSPIGCMLSMDIRPLVCRIYPYNDFNEFGKVNLAPMFCPKKFKMDSDIIHKEMGLSFDEAKHLVGQLYDELRNGWIYKTH